MVAFTHSGGSKETNNDSKDNEESKTDKETNPYECKTCNQTHYIVKMEENKSKNCNDRSTKIKLFILAVIIIKCFFLCVIALTVLSNYTNLTSKETSWTTNSPELETTHVKTYINPSESGALRIISRYSWRSRPPKQVRDLPNDPLKMVIIGHTDTSNCSERVACERLIRSLQNYHMDELQWWDIGYNFMIGGDGIVYEGRGWTTLGAHPLGLTNKSLGIALVGNFMTKKPLADQISACKKLIKFGVQKGYIDSDYLLLGASQVVATKSPGDALMREMKSWHNFSPTPVKRVFTAITP